ncbi:MAG: sodium:solute symporter, partial [Clostridia bacterium]|nr:sodium:solute symporter [Clostridia bacterium]
AILGRRTRILTQYLGSRTMPDYFGLRYKSGPMKTIASVIVFLFLIPYTASLFNGLSRLFTMAFPGVDYAICVIVMAVLTGIYVIVGGYMATAINDFIQGIIMLVGIVATIAAVLSINGGLMGSLERVVAQATETGAEGWKFASFLGPDPVFLLFVVILTSLGTWGLPQMVGKFYSIRDEADIKKGTIISTFFAIVVAGGCYFLGGFARAFMTPGAGGKPEGGFDNVIPTMLQNLPDILIAIVLVLVLSASMSTLSSLVLTSSSTITLDLIAPMRKKEMSEKKKMLVMRIFIAFFIILSAIIAIVQAKSNVVFIAQLMGVSWGALSGAFLAPFLYGLYWKKTTRAGCYASFIFGVGMSLVQLVKSLTGFSFGISFLDNLVFKTSLHSGALAMLCGLIIVPLVSLISQKTKPDGVDEMFSCYDKKIEVSQKTSLTDA